MFRILVTTTALLLVSFAAEALPPNFDRLHCLIAIPESDKAKALKATAFSLKSQTRAEKVNECVTDAKKSRNEKGEIHSAMLTCAMYAPPDRAVACVEYAIEHLDVDRKKIRRECTSTRPEYKFSCLFGELSKQDPAKIQLQEPNGAQALGQPARHGGSVR